MLVVEWVPVNIIQDIVVWDPLSLWVGLSQPKWRKYPDLLVLRDLLIRARFRYLLHLWQHHLREHAKSRVWARVHTSSWEARLARTTEGELLRALYCFAQWRDYLAVEPRLLQPPCRNCGCVTGRWSVRHVFSVPASRRPDSTLFAVRQAYRGTLHLVHQRGLRPAAQALSHGFAAIHAVLATHASLGCSEAP